MSKDRSITYLPGGGCRAHHWGPRGYSTRTFATPFEANAWLNTKDCQS